MLFDNVGNHLSPFFVLEGLNLRNNIIHAGKGPHVVLISDNSIKADKVKHRQAITEEQGPFSHIDKTNHKNGEGAWKDTVDDARSWSTKCVVFVVKVYLIEEYWLGVTIIPASEVIEIGLLYEVPAIKKVEISSKSQENSTRYQSKL